MKQGQLFVLLLIEATFGSIDGNAKPVLKGPSLTWVSEGESVTLSCEVRGSSTSWRFSWYKTVPYRPELTHVLHENTPRYIELLSDSIRGSGGSYTLSPAALRHSGVYVCRAERGEPADHTEFSQFQPLWVTGLNASTLLAVSPNRNQHFTSKSLSLSCEGNGNSTGLRLRWFSDMTENKICPFEWVRTGSSCSINSASSADSGVYWCQSESGGQSNPINITVHNNDVILDGPAHPVTEGDPLTLHCRYRHQPSNISADFYKDGTLLQTSSTGEMTIPAVSKSHEGLYKCRNPRRGESPESWIAVTVHGSSTLASVGLVFGVMVILAVGTILALLYCFKKRKCPGTQGPLTGQQQQDMAQTKNHRFCAGNGDEQEYETHSDCATARLSDVTYATIDQQRARENVRRTETDECESELDIVYSELKTAHTTGEGFTLTQRS